MAESTDGAWRCTVCGYVHRGPQPPEWCPVCGAAAAEFEPHVPEAPSVPKAETERWRCLNCSYVHTGSTPPAECPVCGAPKDRFEPLVAEAGPAGAGKAVKAVVVGAGIAGISAVESLRRFSPDAEITLISKEADLPYYRLNLTRYLAGEVAEDELAIHPASWYVENRVELLLGKEVDSLSPEEKTATLRGGESVPFEKLVLAIGSHPYVPPLPGARREGATSLRSIDDAKRILQHVRAGAACVVIGGGVLGLETAGALARRGAAVTLLESHRWLMPRQLNEEAGGLLRRHVTSMGIGLRTEARSAEIVGDERVAGVLLEDGETVAGDVVIVATGVRSNSYLARRARLQVNQGVVVGPGLACSHPNVLAAGDVAEYRGMLYGNWHASQYQGNIAGMNAAGAGAEFGGIPRSNTLKVLGLDLLSIGQFEPEDGSFRVIEQETDGRYFRFVFHDELLVGSILLGDTSTAASLKRAIEARTDFSGLLRRRPAAADILEYLSEIPAG